MYHSYGAVLVDIPGTSHACGPCAVAERRAEGSGKRCWSSRAGLERPVPVAAETPEAAPAVGGGTVLIHHLRQDIGAVAGFSAGVAETRRRVRRLFLSADT